MLPPDIKFSGRFPANILNFESPKVEFSVTGLTSTAGFVSTIVVGS